VARKKRLQTFITKYKCIRVHVYMYVLYFYVVGCVCQPQINEHVML